MMKNRFFKIKKSSFIEGTFIATLSIVFVKVLGMLYVIPFYAMIGVQGSALYAYAYNIYIIFLDISTNGLPIAISKLISEYDTLSLEEAKIRVYRLGKKMMGMIAVLLFILLFLFASSIATFLIGDLTGGNTIEDVTFVIRAVSFAILIVPFLSISKGFLNGYKIVNVSSVSQVVEQVVRIAVILLGTYLVLYVFHGSLRLAVGVSVFAAFIGGACAYFYVMTKIYKNKQMVGFVKKEYTDLISNKEISKKIFQYAFPFVIINIISSCYNFIDMVLLLRIMEHMRFDTPTIEFVTSAISTWAPKLNMVITSVAMGMTVSLIPTIVSLFTVKNWKGVNERLNQAIQIILFISIPCTIGISLLGNEIWTIFYGYNPSGGLILSINIFTALFINLFMVVSTTLQSLNKFTLVYIITIIGFALNALLDIPFMYLFKYLGIEPFLGVCVASSIGYGVSVVIALLSLKKEHPIHYGQTWQSFRKMLFPVFDMMLGVYVCKTLLSLQASSRIPSCICVMICALVGGCLYLVCAYKTGLIKEIFGSSLLKKLTSKR